MCKFLAEDNLWNDFSRSLTALVKKEPEKNSDKLYDILRIFIRFGYIGWGKLS